MKKCTICGIEKPEDDFYWKNKRNKKKEAKCKPCSRAVSKERYGNKDLSTKQKEALIRERAEAEAQLFNQVNQLWR